VQEELSVIETTRRLGVGIDATYKLIYSGKLPAHKVDGRWRIPTNAVETRLRTQVQRRGKTVAPARPKAKAR
jgi:excisionase family DNA binding protein